MEERSEEGTQEIWDWDGGHVGCPVGRAENNDFDLECKKQEYKKTHH